MLWGLWVDQYLRDLLPSNNGKTEEEPLYRTASNAEWIKAFSEWAANNPVLPTVAEDSRESIYQGRGE